VAQVWDLATRSTEAVWQFEDSQIGNMQNGVQWLGSHIVSVSLVGG
jgi:hypothetical protein